MIASVREHVGIPLFVLIRPRSGDFVYDETELAVMRRDIATARDLGANGIVIGALQPDGTVDADVTGTLVEAARPLEVTFHRAFDFTRDAFEALDAVVAWASAGCSRPGVCHGPGKDRDARRAGPPRGRASGHRPPAKSPKTNASVRVTAA
jgi:copper homeostasis protein